MSINTQQSFEDIGMESSVENSSYTSFSINTSDIKLSQLHRGAEKRGGLSKLKKRYQVNILLLKS
jgi:hypothetical protein